MPKKTLLSRLNKHFDHRVRLGIMSMLMLEEWVGFTDIKEQLDLTDGRLASHIKALEQAKYIEVRKRFVGRKPHTSYRATPSGRTAFTDHLNALEDLLKLRDD